MMRFRRCVLLTVAVVAWTAAPGQAQWMIAPYLGVNVAGGVEQGKGGPGGAAGYLGGRLGFEFDVLRYQHFFQDSENTREGVLFRDYGFLRVSFGIGVEFPR